MNLRLHLVVVMLKLHLLSHPTSATPAPHSDFEMLSRSFFSLRADYYDSNYPPKSFRRVYYN